MNNSEIELHNNIVTILSNAVKTGDSLYKNYITNININNLQISRNILQTNHGLEKKFFYISNSIYCFETNLDNLKIYKYNVNFDSGTRLKISDISFDPSQTQIYLNETVSTEDALFVPIIKNNTIIVYRIGTDGSILQIPLNSEYNSNDYCRISAFDDILCVFKDTFTNSEILKYPLDNNIELILKNYNIDCSILNFYPSLCNNLYCQITSPFSEIYNTEESFNLSFDANDVNYDFSKLLIFQENELIAENDFYSDFNNVYPINIYNYSENEKYNFTIQAYDKAGNMESDSFEFYRNFSEGIVENYYLANKYLNINTPLSINLDLKSTATLNIAIESGSDMVTSINLGEIDKLENYKIDTTGLVDGEYSIKLILTYNGITEYMHDKINIDSILPIITFHDYDKFNSDEAFSTVYFDVDEEFIENISATISDSISSVALDINEENGQYFVSLQPMLKNENIYQIKIEATDKSGNINNNICDYIIDRTSPELFVSSIDSIDAIHSEVVLNFRAADNYAIDCIKIYSDKLDSDHLLKTYLIDSESTETDYNFNELPAQKNIISNACLQIECVDKSGNSTVYKKIFVVDNMAPITEIEYQDPYIINNLPYLPDISVISLTAKANDSYSKVNGTFYSLNGKETIKYDGTIIGFVNGKNSIAYYSIDNLGNIEDSGTSEFYIDNNAPIISIQVDNIFKGKDGLNFISDSSKFHIESYDNEAGVDKVLYRVDSGSWINFNNDFNILKEGLCDIEILAIDNVGNQYQEKYDYIIDCTPPEILYDFSEPYYENLNNGRIGFLQKASLGLSVVDIDKDGYSSGADEIFYSVDSEGYIKYSEPIEIEDSVVLDYFSTDNVGNKKVADQLNLGIDTEAPLLEIVASEKVYNADGIVFTNSGLPIAATAADDFIGVESIWCSNSDEEYSEKSKFIPLMEGPDCVSFYAKDFLGNVSESKGMNIFVDDSAPETVLSSNLPIIEINGKYYADKRYTFSLSSHDFGSGLKDIFCYVNGERVSEDFNIIEEGKFKIDYQAIDNLGNLEDLKTIEIITPIPDTTPPISEIMPSQERLTINGFDYFKNEVCFTIMSVDEIGSYDSSSTGVKNVFVSLDSSEYTESNIVNTTYKDGLHSISFYAIDNAGNVEKEQTYLFYTDSTPPETRILGADDLLLIADTYQIKEQTLLELDSRDETAGVMDTYYSFDNENWVKYLNPLEFSIGDYELYYYSVDLLGNKEDESSCKINVNPNFLTTSFDSYDLFNFQKQHVVFDYDGQTLVYIESSAHPCNDQIFLQDENITRNGKNSQNGQRIKISKTNKKRLALYLFEEMIFAVEKDHEDENLYFYNKTDRNQIGTCISNGGVNSDPILHDGFIYWINARGNTYSIYSYSIDRGTVEVDNSGITKRDGGAVIREPKEYEGIYISLPHIPYFAAPYSSYIEKGNLTDKADNVL